MIAQTFTVQQRQRIHLLPIRDYYDVDRWTRSLAASVDRLAARLAEGAECEIRFLGRSTEPTWVGGGDLLKWRATPLARHGTFSGTAIRERIFVNLGENKSDVQPAGYSSAIAADIADQVPPAVREMVESWLPGPTCERLSREWRALQAYRQSLPSNLGSPILLFIALVARWRDQVLLIRRRQPPGESLLMLPGGQVRSGNTGLPVALNLLRDQTGLQCVAADRGKHCPRPAVFDHPQRSLYGPSVAYAYLIELAGQTRPSIRATDKDEVSWLPVGQLAGWEDEFHEDHFFILEHFLSPRD